MSLVRDFALSLILGVRNVHAVLCHLLRCFDSRFKGKNHCHPAFIIRDNNSCRNGYSKGRLNPGRVITLSYRLLLIHSSQNTPPFFNLDVEKSAAKIALRWFFLGRVVRKPVNVNPGLNVN